MDTIITHSITILSIYNIDMNQFCMLTEENEDIIDCEETFKKPQKFLSLYEGSSMLNPMALSNVLILIKDSEEKHETFHHYWGSNHRPPRSQVWHSTAWAKGTPSVAC